MRDFLIVIGLFLFLAVPEADAAIYHGKQTIRQDTVWDGEVLIDGILTVAPETRLEIRPGTRVRFTFMDSNGDGVGEHEIFIQGQLHATGTAAAPVLFTSAEPVPFPGAWGAINMMMAETPNRMEHCVVEYGYRGFHAHFSRADISDSAFRSNLRGVQFQESTVSIRRCLITGNRNGMQFRDSQVTIDESVIAGNYWGVRCVYADLHLTDCLIQDNLVNGVNLRDSTLRAKGNRIVGNRRGLYLQRTRGDIRGNLMDNNSEHGIFLEESNVTVIGNGIRGNGRSGARWLDSRGQFKDNDLSGNGAYAIINDGDTPLDAAHNWWGGTVRSESLNQRIRENIDHGGLGTVNWIPVLTTRPQIGMNE